MKSVGVLPSKRLLDVISKESFTTYHERRECLKVCVTHLVLVPTVSVKFPAIIWLMLSALEKPNGFNVHM